MKSGPIASRDVHHFRVSIERLLGLQHDDAKLAFVAAVLEERLAATKRALPEYLALLDAPNSSRDELRALAGRLTVAETYFFRNGDQFRVFQELALPQRIAARAISRRVSILSAACASGEEPYSLAIAAREVNLDKTMTVAITAVDVNPDVLEKARSGRYSSWSLRDTPPEVIQRWFVQRDNEYVLDESIRSAVRFEEANLLSAGAELWASGIFDIIFCRNVLMYFAPDKAAFVVDRIAGALVPGGYLFLGHAETLRGLSHDFHLRHTHGTFYYQRKDELSHEDRAAPYELAIAAGPSVADVESSESWIEVVQKSADRIHALAERSQANETKAKYALPVSELSLAFELLKRERFAEALELLAALPPEAGSDDDVVLLRAALLTHAGRLQAAEEACRELLVRDDLHAGAYYLLALCREGSGDRKTAADHDQTAAYLDPSFAMPHLHLGLLARKAADNETARDELSRALMLLQREELARVLLFGGGFNREALIALCRAELAGIGGER